MDMKDLKNCIETFEQNKCRLSSIEEDLARKLNIHPGSGETIRSILIDQNLTGKLDHCRLVDDWHKTYLSFMDYIDNYFDDLIQDNYELENLGSNPKPR
jgi:hypothetical protein